MRCQQGRGNPTQFTPQHRWVPLNPNTDTSKSQSIQSLSGKQQLCHSNVFLHTLFDIRQNQRIFTCCCLFGLRGTHLYSSENWQEIVQAKPALREFYSHCKESCSAFVKSQKKVSCLSGLDSQCSVVNWSRPPFRDRPRIL